VSWQLGMVLVLGLALAGGFAWYERSRPDARTVALVATLAAFAALGRIAFAAIPNVKPTTDIVILSGYALGPAPGFMVGAAAGLTSNFFFGQGPWTPWQMAGWGIAGLLGAGLGRLTGRRAGRWSVAIACMGVGFGFTAFQDIGDWANFSDHSLGGLGVYVGKGLGFDGIHAAGCLIFALAFGPALARSLARFSARLHVIWRAPGGAVVPVILIAVAILLSQSVRDAPTAHAASDPISYLLAAQNPDGGFGPAPGQTSTQLFSGWAALGLAAEGRAPSRVARHGHSLIGYLRSAAGSATDPGAVERSILAAVVAGVDAHHFGGRDLLAALAADTGQDGSVSDQANLTAFAVLARRAAGAPVWPQTFAWLIAQQDRDGGFNYATAGAESDVDDTGAVLEALVGDTRPAASRARGRAIHFITSHQNTDGGFPSSAGSSSNAQSTAWAVQGLIAAGFDPASVHRAGGPSPLAYLNSLIAPDGHVRYSRSSDQTPVWATAEAVMALAGKPLPLARVPVPAAASRRLGTSAGSTSVRSTHGKTVHQVGGVARRGAAHIHDAGPTSAAMRLAIDAGILEAVALAPIGVG
jgi:energy-coupling factor transport system substrate-specific component